jgi:hypothetical protein
VVRIQYRVNGEFQILAKLHCRVRALLVHLLWQTLGCKVGLCQDKIPGIRCRVKDRTITNTIGIEIRKSTFFFGISFVKKKKELCFKSKNIYIKMK